MIDLIVLPKAIGTKNQWTLGIKHGLIEEFPQGELEFILFVGHGQNQWNEWCEKVQRKKLKASLALAILALLSTSFPKFRPYFRMTTPKFVKFSFIE